VSNKLVSFTKRRPLFFASLIAVAVAGGLLCAEFRLYAYAVIWHRAHGDFATIGGHRVKLPTLWWKEDADAYDTSLLERAGHSNTFLASQIVVSPAIPGEMRDSDEEELKSTQAIVAIRNRSLSAGTTLSTITLYPKPFKLYCTREGSVISGVKLYSQLLCEAARVPYSFIYNGNPTQENEAESILSTLE